MTSSQSIKIRLKRITLLKVLISYFRKIKSNYYEKIYLIEGQESQSKQQLTLLYSGPVVDKHYFIYRIFGDSNIKARESSVRKNRLWLHAKNKNTKHDLAIIKTDNTPDDFKGNHDLFLLPCWVGGLKDLTKFAKSADYKDARRLIRKNNLGLRISNTKEDFLNFFHQMYLPYIKSAHGSSAFLRDFEDVQSIMHQCELLFVTQDGEDISGLILHYQEPKPTRAWLIGVKDGDSKWVKLGAISAFEYFETERCLEKGYRQLHNGTSRPFLNDGVLRFKLKRCLSITDYTDQSFAVIPLKQSPGLSGFLQNNPFLYKDKGKLSGAIFIPQDSPCNQDMAGSLSKKWFASEVINLNLFSINNDKSSDLSFQYRGQINGKGVLSLPSIYITSLAS